MGKKPQEIRIVLDTNIFISALGWRGEEKKILEKCIDGTFNLFLSKDILNEIERVLNYPKFNFSEKEKTEFLNLLRKISTIVKPSLTLEIIKQDSEDNKILECAIESQADFVISGDDHLLSLGEFEEIKILRASEFLKECTW